MGLPGKACELHTFETGVRSRFNNCATATQKQHSSLHMPVTTLYSVSSEHSLHNLGHTTRPVRPEGDTRGCYSCSSCCYRSWFGTEVPVSRRSFCMTPGFYCFNWSRSVSAPVGKPATGHRPQPGCRQQTDGVGRNPGSRCQHAGHGLGSI